MMQNGMSLKYSETKFSVFCSHMISTTISLNNLIVNYISSFTLPFFLIWKNFRSLVEEEDQHMKLSLGSSEMGLSSHLQSSKAGTTRIFTSNTHSSVVLQVI